jgi:hypothetical protein
VANKTDDAAAATDSKEDTTKVKSSKEEDTTTEVTESDEKKEENSTEKAAAAPEEEAKERKESGEVVGATKTESIIKDKEEKESTAGKDDTTVHLQSDNKFMDEGGDASKPAEEDKIKPAAKGITYATVLEGEPAFTEAATHYPDKKCPLSGLWKGYFQNVAAPGSQAGTTRVQEQFYLFLNAMPGPHPKYFYDETALPPTIANSNSLVLVTGTGENPFAAGPVTTLHQCL